MYSLLSMNNKEKHTHIGTHPHVHTHSHMGKTREQKARVSVTNAFGVVSLK